MLPSIKTPPKPNLSDLTVLLYGQTKIGKCLAGNTELVNPANGRIQTIQDLVRGAQGAVLTMKEAGQIGPVMPSAFVENEPAQLYRLRTQTGRTIEATASHPFLTRAGWKSVSELTTADRVAVVAEYPLLSCAGDTDDDLVKIMAYLIADGSISGLSPVFTKNDPLVRMDFESAVEAKGDECVEYLNDRGVTHVRVRGKAGKRNNVICHLKEVGLQGVTSADKVIPPFVFGLKRSKQKLFLNRLFSCDGSVEAKGRISYSSTSTRLVQQAQHLLSRFGIVSLIRDKFLEGQLYGSELIIAAKNDILKFIDEIGFVGEKEVKAAALRHSLYNVRAADTQLDRLGSVLFDRVISIEPTCVGPVYDLTIDGSHNFVANDFVVHNSSFCAQADDALFLATEPGLNALDVYQAPILSWDDLLNACKEISDGGHPFRTIIIDTIDNAYKFCTDYVLKKAGKEHESDLGYGKGYALINNEFQRVLNKLAFLPYGLFLISHAKETEVETDSEKYTRIVPTLPDKARKIVLGLVDMVLYCGLEPIKGQDGEKNFRRVIRTKPSLYYEAGDRTGRLPATLDLDYGKFLEAFNAAVAPLKPQAAAKPAAK
jgi:hypothetical protein